jgi:hypothetical protein
MWPKYVVVVGVNEGHQQTLEAQPDADLVVKLLQSDSHWAVLYLRRSTMETLLCDGYMLESIVADAKHFLAYYHNTYGEHAAEIAIADTGKQNDGWSCGQRVMMITAWLLLQGAHIRPYQQKLKQYTFPQRLLNSQRHVKHAIV